jgi:hypothetical protein
MFFFQSRLSEISFRLPCMFSRGDIYFSFKDNELLRGQSYMLFQSARLLIDAL